VSENAPPNFFSILEHIPIGKISIENGVPETGKNGPEGIRTPGLWIKSPSLYLTKLQAHEMT
jgi:hypothetical protein